MSKPELGTKRDCPECGARFYDLTKEPAHCPKCDHEFIPEALLKPRKSPKDEVAADKTDEPAKPENETSLESADKEQKVAESKKRAALDEDDSDDNDEDDELAAIADIDIDDDDDEEKDNDDNLLVEEDETDVSTIVKPTGDDD